MAFQDNSYIMMSLGSSTRPPVLIDENEFSQWQDRFIHFIEMQNNSENIMRSLLVGPFEKPYVETPATADTPATRELKKVGDYTPEEKNRLYGDQSVKSFLMQALPNHIYRRIDCYKNNSTMMWSQLEKIMLGSAVATQLKQTRFMNNFDGFKAKDNESLKSVFDRFWAVLNDLHKIKVTKTELEANLKFLNALQPEWNKSCHKLRNDVRISTMQIQELYEILMTDEEIVLAKREKIDKKAKGKMTDPVALLAKQLAEKSLMENAFDGSVDDEGENLEKAMILLSQHFQKKYEKKTVVTCFKCGKMGHMARECRGKAVKNAAYYKKKLELAEKRESGTALLVEEEYFLNDSDDEVCFFAKDASDDEADDHESSSDEFEVPSKFDYDFLVSQMNLIVNAIRLLRSNLLSEKETNNDQSKLIETLKINIQDEKMILVDTKEKFQKKLDELEETNKSCLETLNLVIEEKDIFSDKIIELENKLYKRGQSDQTIFLNKPRSYVANEENWGLGFENPHFLDKAKTEVPTLYEFNFLHLARYAPQFKINWTSEEEISKLEEEKRKHIFKMQLPFVYPREKDKNISKTKDSNKDSLSNDYFDIYAYGASKENKSEVLYDTKRYIPPLVLEAKIVNLENKIVDLESKLESNFKEDKDKRNVPTDFKEDKMDSDQNKNPSSSKFENDSESNISESKKENNSEEKEKETVSKIEFLNKILSSESIIKSEKIDDSFTMNSKIFKSKRRKRRRSKKRSKIQVPISEIFSDSSTSIFSDRALNKRRKQVWVVKSSPPESSTSDSSDIDDNICNKNTFAFNKENCNNSLRYSIKQMFQIANDGLCSSSSCNSDGCVDLSDSEFDNDSFYHSHAYYDNIFRKKGTNKKGSKFIWVPKSV